MIKAHKIRLNPTPEQAQYFTKAAGTARFCLNWALAEWKQQYEAGGKPNAKALKKQFHAIRKQQFPWTYDVSKSVVEGAFMDVASAFKNFFEGLKTGKKRGYPKFRRSGKQNQPFTLPMIGLQWATIGWISQNWDASIWQRNCAFLVKSSRHASRKPLPGGLSPLRSNYRINP